jgi:hypothetical protein
MLKTDRMVVGDLLPTRELTTIRDSRITVPTPDALTHLQLRRYAGCPICNLHLRVAAPSAVTGRVATGTPWLHHCLAASPRASRTSSWMERHSVR